MLSQYGIDRETFRRFLEAVDGWAFRLGEHWAGDRLCVARVGDAAGAWHSYRPHDIRMLAARA